MEIHEPYCFEEFKQYCEDNGIDYDIDKIKEARGICYLENSDKSYPIYF